MTISNRFQNNKRGLPKALLALAVMTLTILWACHLGPDDAKDTFDIAGDTAWTHCDTVTVVLLDSAGNPVDTLFNQPLNSLSQLQKLDAEKYPGGKGGIQIKGSLDGGVCFEQKRTFERPDGKVIVDTLRDPTVSPKSISVRPDSLVLTMGSPAANLNASVVPDYADPSILWTVDGSGVVSLEGLSSGKGNPARVKPLKAGKATVTARSAKDTSVSITIPVRVVSTSTGGIKLSKDEVLLYVEGPSDSLSVTVPEEYAGQKIEWKTGRPEIAEVDASGRIKPLKEGETTVQATLTPSGLSDVAVVKVVRDVPVLTVSSKSGAAVNAPIIFSPTAVQKFGTLVLYKWDFTSDGEWDDSLTTGWSGDTVNLPAVTTKYVSAGSVVAKFHVRDSEGNVAEAQVLLDIGNQAPEIADLRNDTVISVKDSIGMSATARDADGKVTWVGWDYEGDGQFDDTLALSDSATTFAKGHRYQEAGSYPAVFKAIDDNGKARQDTVRIKVEFDEPVADAGPDFTVIAGAAIDISVKGTDKFGSIAKRELKVGNGAFVALSKQDTSFPAPAQPTVLKCIIRVTDDDGLSDVDTVEVTVILSSNANLSDLAFSAGPLEPGFQPNATFYAARVAFADSLVSVTPKATDASTKITVNGKTTASGSASDQVKLQLGSNANAFQIIVTAADGSQRVYSVSVTRDPNGEATLSKLEAPGFTLLPAFDATTLDYADTVTHSVSTITFKPTVASAGATLSFNDSGMTSGTFTAPQALDYGENVFKFTVTAQDGKSVTVYQVKILRLGRLYIYRKLDGAAAVLQDSADIPIGSPSPLLGGGSAAYKFVKWTLAEGSADIADSAANSTTITMESGVVKAEANFEILKYTITVSITGCGKSDTGTVTRNHGANQGFTLTPEAGCRIASVKVDGNEDTTAYDGKFAFTNITAPHTLDIRFVRTYLITWSVGPKGKGTVLPATITADSGTSATFRFKPDAGYKVAKGGICDGPSCGILQPKPDSTFTIAVVQQARAFTVSFVRGYRMYGLVESGQGEINPRDSLVDSASMVVYRFSPGAGYKVDTLIVNGVLTGQTSPGVYVVGSADKETTVKVAFIRQFTLTVINKGPGGTLNQSTHLVDSANSVPFTATPEAGVYRVDSVQVDGVLVPTMGTGTWSPRSWTVQVSSNVTVRVTYKRYYQLSVKHGTGGSLSPTPVNVDSGTTQAFAITLDNGYYVSTMTMDGVTNLMPFVSGTTLTLTNVTSAGTIVAGFSNMYTITVQSNVSPVGGKTAPPRVCIVNQSAADTACTSIKVGGPSSATLVVEYGSKMAAAAVETYRDCGGIQCVSYSFAQWTGFKVPSVNNPLSFAAGQSVTLTAEYTNGDIKAAVKGFEP